jgi:hypothetical protein
MTQLAGTHRPEKFGTRTNNNTVGVARVDHHANGAQMSSVYGAPQTILIDDTTTLGTTYVGFAAPGSDTVEGRADNRWKIMASSDSGVRWAHTILDPATPGTGPDYAGRPEHVWDDRASLDYA